MNPLVNGLARLGVSIVGSRELRVRGRVSGELRATPVNVLTHDSARYLVSPRGQTQWVRNVRAGGQAELRLGRRVETVELVEVADADKVEILRAYLRRWAFEVGVFFDGVGPDAPDADLRAIAGGYPVFHVQPVQR